jgi:hypothetical protein
MTQLIAFSVAFLLLMVGAHACNNCGEKPLSDENKLMVPNSFLQMGALSDGNMEVHGTEPTDIDIRSTTFSTTIVELSRERFEMVASHPPGCVSTAPNPEDAFALLRLWECTATTWSLKRPTFMQNVSGMLYLNFKNPGNSERTVADETSILIDGDVVETMTNIGCFPRCLKTIRWQPHNEQLTIISSSDNQQRHLHAFIINMGWYPDSEGEPSEEFKVISPRKKPVEVKQNDFAVTAAEPSGCDATMIDREDEFRLRLKRCTNTTWALDIPEKMQNASGILYFTFQSDKDEERSKTDAMSILIDGEVTDTMMNTGCFPKCVKTLRWESHNKQLVVHSSSDIQRKHLHSRIDHMAFYPHACGNCN